MSRSWRLCIPLAVTIALGAAGPASAYRFVGKKWPAHTITYYNAAKSSAPAVANAVYAWNTSGANVRFVAVPKAQASVLIVTVNRAKLPDSGERGVATAGWAPPGTVSPDPTGHGTVHGAHVWLVPPALDGGMRPFERTQVAAHELGHVLGLGHETRGCATMNPLVNEFCKAPHAWQENCRTLQRDDVQGAVALYGGHVHGSMSPEFCDLAPVPTAPRGLTATVVDPVNGLVKLDWINPGGLTLAGGSFSLSALHGRPTVEQYVVSGAQNVCPPPPASGHALSAGPADAGAAGTTTVQARPGGQWCYTVAVADAFRRLSAPVHVMVTVPA